MTVLFSSVRAYEHVLCVALSLAGVLGMSLHRTAFIMYVNTVFTWVDTELCEL